MTKPLKTVVLAAGKGTRMKSAKAKVLHEVFHSPMVHHVIRALLPLKPKQNIVVVGHQKEEVKRSLDSFSVSFATQTEQLGTGHAVLAAEPLIEGEDGTIMIICGDTPLILTETLQAMVTRHEETGAALTLMTTVLTNPTNYGRVLSNETGGILEIVEEKDATESQKEVKEINAGIYCVDQNFLFSTLKRVGTDNSQGEVYLTDIVAMAVQQGLKAEKFINPEPDHVLGVNSRVELSRAHLELMRRRNNQLMMDGVTIYSPDTVNVADQASIEKDTILEAGSTVLGKSEVATGCIIGQGTVIIDSILEANVQVGPYAYLKGQRIAEGSIVRAHAVTGDE